MRQVDPDKGRRSDGLTIEEREEIRRLRRENCQLRQEREILAKAAAWFEPGVSGHQGVYFVSMGGVSMNILWTTSGLPTASSLWMEKVGP